jgi:L-ascorbate metabolism protein UlaG (beta-lactamase superfamily)
VPTGLELIADIDRTPAISPTLWWLGHAGFAIKYHHMVFYVDPFLSARADRLHAPLLDPAHVRHAQMILSTQATATHMDLPALKAMLAASPEAKLVLPKSAAEHAREHGIEYGQMRTTDNGLRVEYFGMGDYMRVYAVPSAKFAADGTPQLSHTVAGGYPYLGYLIRAGNLTIYHAGDCVPYEGLAQRLRPYNVNVALLGVSGPPDTFTMGQAAALCAEIGAKWLCPMHYGMFADTAADPEAMTAHLLGHHPSLRFKLFEPGVAWEVPEE